MVTSYRSHCVSFSNTENGVCNWNTSLRKKSTCSSSKADIIVADDLAMQGTRASAAMLSKDLVSMGYNQLTDFEY